MSRQWPLTVEPEALRKLQLTLESQSLSSGRASSLKGPSPGIALVTHSGDAGGRGSVRQGWEEKIPKKMFFLLPWKMKGARGLVVEGPQNPRAPPRPPLYAAGMVKQRTHSSKLCGTAFRVYREIILLFLLNCGRGGQARAGASTPDPTAGSCPLPHSGSPRLRTATSPGSPPLQVPTPRCPAGPEVTKAAEHPPNAPADAQRGRRRGFPGLNGLLTFSRRFGRPRVLGTRLDGVWDRLWQLSAGNSPQARAVGRGGRGKVPPRRRVGDALGPYAELEGGGLSSAKDSRPRARPRALSRLPEPLPAFLVRTVESQLA